MPQAGIVVGCDAEQECLLPWWWHHYSATNSYPVLFIDFGMSEKARRWCQKRGLYAPLQRPQEFVQKSVAPEKKQKWETSFPAVFDARGAFFKKPFAILQSPFFYTLWIDLDCQVLGSLEPIFHFLHLGCEISLRVNPQSLIACIDPELLVPSEQTSYNSGVIACRQDGTVIKAWTEEIFENNHKYIGDENALSYVISRLNPFVLELPLCYNWSPFFGPNPQAVIVHYQGNFKNDLFRSLKITGKPTPSFSS